MLISVPAQALDKWEHKDWVCYIDPFDLNPENRINILGSLGFASRLHVKKDGKTFGIIDLPKFYIDFDEENYRNSTKDMAQEIERLKKENIEVVSLSFFDIASDLDIGKVDPDYLFEVLSKIDL